MSHDDQVNEDGGPHVPAYIVTFSDMVTLLLTFFVMLLALSNVRDPELFNISRDAFTKYIKGFGLGFLSGKKMTPDFGKPKIKYYVSDPDKTLMVRSIDAKEENIRRKFKKVVKSMKTRRSQIVAQKTNFSVTNIHFSSHQMQLNKSAKKFLTQFALDLQQDTDTKGIKLYVLGLAGDEPTGKKQLILSAKRADAVADFLKSVLPSELKWPIYSWGAGAGGHWVAQDSPISRQSQILIAVLRSGD